MAPVFGIRVAVMNGQGNSSPDPLRPTIQNKDVSRIFAAEKLNYFAAGLISHAFLSIQRVKQ
jgi:hypothetical protein